MLKTMKYIAGAALFMAASSAFAADLYVPPVVEAPQPQPQVVYQNFGGWYLRGDIDYHWSKVRDTSYITYGCPGGPCGAATPPGTDDFDGTDLKGAFSLGAGVGYQINSYLRTDLTADYWFKSDFKGTSTGSFCGGGPCSSTDQSSFSALLLLANAYVDLGTYQGITPYIGAGIGGARVDWGDFVTDGTGEVHPGESGWRFAWAAMAGASYCLTDNIDLDVGYRFSRIEGGRMFQIDASNNVGPGRDGGIDTHEVRAGVRYQFGAGSGRCSQPETVAYEPMAEKPVYK